MIVGATFYARGESSNQVYIELFVKLKGQYFNIRTIDPIMIGNSCNDSVRCCLTCSTSPHMLG